MPDFRLQGWHKEVRCLYFARATGTSQFLYENDISCFFAKTLKDFLVHVAVTVNGKNDNCSSFHLV